MTNDKGTEKLFGETLPGTRGDFLDSNDTEGHRARPGNDVSRRDDELDTLRLRNTDGSTDQDVEGHLFRSGPTTQGDFAKRAPSDTPHGER